MQVEVEPFLPGLKGLSLDNVHVAQEKLLILQKEIEVLKNQLRIPEMTKSPKKPQSSTSLHFNN